MRTEHLATKVARRRLSGVMILYWGLCVAAGSMAVWGTFNDPGTGRRDAGTGTPEQVAFADEDMVGPTADALDLLDFPWRERLPRWTIEFAADEGGSVRGYTWSAERRIVVFVEPHDTPEELARVLAHELGHAIDVEHNDAGERRRWSEQRGLIDVPWWPASGRRDFGTGAGDFAEVFAAWLVGPDDFRSEVGLLPDADDLALLRELALGPE